MSMIKAATKDSVFIGLSSKNVQMLQQRKPIVFNGDDIGLPGIQFCISWGETEEAIAEELTAAGIIGPQVVSVIDKFKAPKA
jgi:hypothetical protein